MKALVINSCINPDNAETCKILYPFIDGMKNAGAVVEVVNTAKLNIEPCRACTSDPYYLSDGICNCNDDMQSLYPKFKNADIWVFGVQINNNHVPRKLKNLLDRMEPLFHLDNERMIGEPNQNDSKEGKLALISTSNTWNIEDFSFIVEHLNALSNLFNKDFINPILRPHAEVLNTFNKFNISISDITDAAREAGKMLIKTGNIPVDILKTIKRTLAPRDSFIEELDTMVLKKLAI